MGCDSQTSSPAAPFTSQSPATSQMQVEQPPQGTVVCGQTVQGNVTLTANLNCNGNGLIVGDDGTTINLNGYGIYGPGADTSGGGSTPRSELVQDFCSALRRGDLEDAEDLVDLLGGGTISSLAKVLCRLVQ
jgi:hypothetical protein